MDQLVSGPVVVDGADHLDHVRDGVLREEHAAEGALFRRNVVRRCPLEVVVPRDLGDAHVTLLPRASERGTNALLPPPDSVLADSSDILAALGAPHHSPGG